MEIRSYRMADLNMELGMMDERLVKAFAPWEYPCSENPQIRMYTTDALIDAEPVEEGARVPRWLKEMNALYRGICEQCIEYDTVLIHGSALEMEGKGFLFCGHSGAGKSTHARMWRETFQDKVIMINDDKPLLRRKEDAFWIYGTPVNGKHRLSENRSVELNGICFIVQGAKNQIRKLSNREAMPKLMEQLYRAKTTEYMWKLLGLLDGILCQIPVYELQCTISEEAAQLAWKVMGNMEEKIDEA